AAQLFRLAWLGHTKLTADEAFGTGQKGQRSNRVAECAAWLTKFLAEFAYPSKEIDAAARKESFTIDNVNRAKAVLKKDGLRNSNRGRFQGAWWCGFGRPEEWTLRPEPQTPEAQNTPPETRESPETPDTPDTLDDQTLESLETHESLRPHNGPPES